MNKLEIFFDSGMVRKETDDKIDTQPLSSPEGFRMVADAWLRAGWDAKYVYGFTWMGRPIIQQPEDMIRIQELIFQIKPDLIIETGIAHGGSLIYYASLLALLDYSEGYSKDEPSGREIVGIDIEIRPHNRKAIKEHSMTSLITMIQGSSVDSNVIKQVEEIVNYKNGFKEYNSTILILLDSNHTKEHVLKELELYSKFVSVGSYIITCDGYIKQFVGKDNAPRSEPDWTWNNPNEAVKEFLAKDDNNEKFILEEPKFQFNEGSVENWTSYFSGGFLKRIV